MSPLLRHIRTVRQHFWDVLDSDAVLVYQSTVYPLIFIAGVQMWCTRVPRALSIALEDRTESVWLALAILGPVVTLAGVLMSTKDAYGGAAIQCSGNVMVGFVFGTYTLGVIGENWGQGVFAPIVFIALALWSLMLSLRDFRKILKVEREIAHR